MKLTKQTTDTIRNWVTVTEVILPNLKRYCVAKIELLITDGKKGDRIAFKLERELTSNEKITSVIENRVTETLIEALAKELEKPYNFYIFSTIGNRIVHTLKEVRRSQKHATSYTKHPNTENSGDRQTQTGHGGHRRIGTVDSKGGTAGTNSG